MNDARATAELEQSPIPADLGEVQELFKAGTTNVAAGFFMALALVIGGLYGLIWHLWKVIEAGGNAPVLGKDGASWLVVFMMIGLMLLLIVGGFAVGWYANSLQFRRVYLCTHGLFVIRSRSAEPIRWDQLQEIVETSTQEHFPLHGIAKHALPVKTSRTYRIVRIDGWRTILDGDAVKKIGEIGQILEDRAQQFKIPWSIVRQ
jgi:hypothetical protein